VRGHGLGVFQCAASFQIGGDARGAEGVAADPAPCAELGGAALDHAPGVDTVHGRGGQRAGAAGGGAEEGGLAAVANTGRLDIGVEIGLQIRCTPQKWMTRKSFRAAARVAKPSQADQKSAGLRK
jgi:hypothetical protein